LILFVVFFVIVGEEISRTNIFLLFCVKSDKANSQYFCVFVLGNFIFKAKNSYFDFPLSWNKQKTAKVSIGVFLAFFHVRNLLIL
jgi:hypothetical protein